MGEPLNIYELAKTMVILAGLKPEEDLEIQFTGLGEGEKIAEELWEEWERPAPTESERILAIRSENPRGGVLREIEQMEDFLARGDRSGLLEYIHGIFPEFGWNRSRAIAQVAAASGQMAAMPSAGAA